MMIELVKVDKEIEKIMKIVDYKFLFKLIKDNSIIGFGTINNEIENDLYLFVEEKMRGNGYGKILFSKLLEEVKKLNYKEVTVKFEKENIQMLKIVKSNGGLHLSSNDNVVKYLIPLTK